MPDVILPALDEESALPWVLDRMPDGYRPIVVDNGSTDRTAEVARELGATVVVETQQGFGAACWAGLAAATAEVVCFMDADASFDPTELPLVADPVSAGKADLVLGARDAERGAWPWHARLANKVLAARGPPTKRRGYQRSGPDAFGAPHRAGGPRPDGPTLGLAARDGAARAHDAGWHIEEVRVSYRARIGRSKVTGTVRGTVRAINDMSRLLAADSPD